MNGPQAGQGSRAGDTTPARVAGPRARPRRPPRCLPCPACPTRCLLPVHASAPPHGLPTVWHQSTTACQASFAVLVFFEPRQLRTQLADLRVELLHLLRVGVILLNLLFNPTTGDHA